MKIRELMEVLKDLDPEMECIMQGDAEGNDYSPLAGADPDAIYIAETTWYGKVYSTDWSAEDADMSESEWKKMLKNPRCLVLYPVN